MQLSFSQDASGKTEESFSGANKTSQLAYSTSIFIADVIMTCWPPFHKLHQRWLFFIRIIISWLHHLIITV